MRTSTFFLYHLPNEKSFKSSVDKKGPLDEITCPPFPSFFCSFSSVIDAVTGQKHVVSSFHVFCVSCVWPPVRLETEGGIVSMMFLTVQKRHGKCTGHPKQSKQNHLYICTFKTEPEANVEVRFTATNYFTGLIEGGGGATFKGRSIKPVATAGISSSYLFVCLSLRTTMD